MTVLKSYTFDSGSTSTPLGADWAITNVGTGSNFDMVFNTTRATSATASGSTIARNTHAVPAANGVDAVMSVYKNSVATGTQAVFLGIGHTGSFTRVTSATLPMLKPGAGFALQITDAGAIYAFFQNGSTTTYATPTNAFPTLTAGVFWKTRLVYTAGRAKAKVWLASTTEPSTWNVDEALPTGMTFPDGNFWMGSINTSGNSTTQNAYTDDLTISDVTTATVNVSTAVTPATASALAVDPAFKVIYPANDTRSLVATQDASSTNQSTTTSLIIGNTSTPAVMQFAFPTLPSGSEVVSASLVVKHTSDFGTTGVPVKITAVDVAWTETSASTTAVPHGATTFDTFSMVGTSSARDITPLVKEWHAGTRTNNGLALGYTGSGAASGSIYSRENTTGKPTLTVDYYVPGTSVTVPAGLPGTASAAMPNASVSAGQGKALLTTPATASAALVEPSVSPGKGKTVVTTPATAQALLVDPTVAATTSPNVTLAVPAMSATAGFTGGAFSAPVVIKPNAIVSSASLVEPVVSSLRNAIIRPAAFQASATVVPVAQEQGEVSDPYYQRVLTQVQSRDFWLRMDETSGTSVINRINNQAIGTYVNGPVLGKFGLENRRYVQFDGLDDYVNLIDTDIGARTGTMETVFRTDDADGTIFFGADAALFSDNNLGAFATQNIFITEVGLREGKVRVAFSSLRAFTGTISVNDNRWHHLVVTWRGGRLHVYLDGQLQFRRYLESNDWIAVPDTIGRGFKGDLMEFIFLNDHALNDTDAVRNYYAAFGVEPIQAGVMGAVAAMGDNKGKGNRKRALALYWHTEYDNNARESNLFDRYNWTGISHKSTRGGNNYVVTDHRKVHKFNMQEYDVFTKSVIRDEAKTTGDYLGGAYFDEVSGEYRYLDLAKDVDTSEYDLVFFLNLPERRAVQYSAAQFEQLIDGVRRAQDRDGFAIWAPQPELAIELGIVDRVEAHSMLWESKFKPEQGNASGMYDVRAKQVDPWSFGPDAYYYQDYHGLNKWRVAAQVEGFTDLKGYVIEDYFHGTPRDIFGLSYSAMKYKEVENLTIGMEEYYALNWARNFSLERWERRSVVSVPAANVKAGTVVARETATHWLEDKEVVNPWKDNAVAILVDRGQSVKGRPVNGRIFVSFMAGNEESNAYVVKQMVPPDSQILDPLRRETPAMRAWGYSQARVQQTSQGISGGASGARSVGETPDGEAAEEAARKELVQSLRNNKIVISITEEEKYPLEYYKRWSLIDRAFNWMGQSEEIGDGDKIVRVSAMEATATAVQPTIVAEKDMVVNAQAMIGNATLVKPTNVLDGAVRILALPITASARFSGYNRIIKAAPFVATGTIVENFDMIHASGEQIVLYMHSAEAILYLKEDYN